MYLLVKRALIAGIVENHVAKAFYVKAASLGWRKNEPSRITNETPRLFSQLVYRAVNENEISIQKGAELLDLTFDELVPYCSFGKER